MRVAFELSGEHPTLPRAEAHAVVKTFGGRVEGSTLRRVALAEVGAEPRDLALRLAMSYRLVEVVGEAPCDGGAIAELADRVPLEGTSFAVRCSRLDASLGNVLPITIARELGRALATRGRVDLETPDVIVRVLLDGLAIVGIERATVDRSAFEARHVEERAFFSPISMHPRLARALVNLSGVPKGGRIWDPFSGTGGIALEAALVGARTIASDLDARMVKGTRDTLERLAVTAELHRGDVADVGAGLVPVDAIVTDPPYGRASSTHSEDVLKLYERFFEAAAGALAPGGRVVCVLPRASDVELAAAWFGVVEEHAWYVHRSLTRHIFVLKKM